jgi:nitronate monooxygenase
MSRFTPLGLELPVIQAPLVGVQDSQLALAVCAAGGLGSLPAAGLSLEQLRSELSTLKAGTDRPWNVNFFAHTPPTPDPVRETAWRQALLPYYREFGIDPESIPAGAGRMPFGHAAADLIDEFRPAVVSFHFGLPANDLLQRVRASGAQIIASATTVDEARWLEAHGVDAVIAQGLEAGGHRGHFLTDDLTKQMGTFTLLPQIVAAVRCPVIATGGIVDAASAGAARALGAAAIQAGTVYMLCPEAITSPLHRAALQAAGAEHTALTSLFTGRPARGTRHAARGTRHAARGTRHAARGTRHAALSIA